MLHWLVVIVVIALEQINKCRYRYYYRKGIAGDPKGWMHTKAKEEMEEES